MTRIMRSVKTWLISTIVSSLYAQKAKFHNKIWVKALLNAGISKHIVRQAVKQLDSTGLSLTMNL